MLVELLHNSTAIVRVPLQSLLTDNAALDDLFRATVVVSLLVDMDLRGPPSHSLVRRENLTVVVCVAQRIPSDPGDTHLVANAGVDTAPTLPLAWYAEGGDHMSGGIVVREDLAYENLVRALHKALIPCFR